MEGSCCRLLENSIATTLLFMHLHTYLSSYNYFYAFMCSMYLLVRIFVQFAFRLCCACVIYLSHTHTDVIVGLLKNSLMSISISVAFVLFFLMLNDIR